MDEWVDKTQYIHTTGYHSAINGNEIPIHPATWMNLEKVS